VPPGVVTRTLADPAAFAGVVAVIEVALTTVKLVTATPPIVTLVAPVKYVPAIVTEPPPPVVPELGVTELTVGGRTLTRKDWNTGVALEDADPLVVGWETST